MVSPASTGVASTNSQHKLQPALKAVAQPATPQQSSLTSFVHRFLLWEAVVRSPEEVFKHVPKQDLDKYQYYNIPVSADTADASSPVNVLKVCV
jgi:hypothetical protein